MVEGSFRRFEPATDAAIKAGATLYANWSAIREREREREGERERQTDRETDRHRERVFCDAKAMTMYLIATYLT